VCFLVPCPACNRTVSRYAPACPACGHPVAQSYYETPIASHANIGAEEPAETAPAESVPAKPSAASTAVSIAAAAGGDSPSGAPELARRIPGTVPAAVISMAVAAVNGWASTIPGQHVRFSFLPALAVGLGLWFGKTSFRTWAAVAYGAGLVIWPILMLTGVLGPASVGDYVELGINVGVLLLLVGKPTPLRVWAGVGACLATVLAIVGIGVVEGATEGVRDALNEKSGAGAGQTQPALAVRPAMALGAEGGGGGAVSVVHRSPLEEEVRLAHDSWHERVLGNELENDLGYWAKRVSYFDHGTVNHDHIRRDRAHFYNAPYHKIAWSAPRITETDGGVEVVEDVQVEIGPIDPARKRNVSARLAAEQAVREHRAPRAYAARVEVRMVWKKPDGVWQIASIQELKVYWRRYGADVASAPRLDTSKPPGTSSGAVEMATAQPEPEPERLPQVARPEPGKPYGGQPDGHSVQSVASEGRYVELEDESLWEVAETERDASAEWEASAEISVEENQPGPFPYKLINHSNNESVLVRLVKQ
jgi:hypothetical protein